MVHISKQLYPVSTGVISGTTATLLYGPIEMDHYESLYFSLYNCSTVNMNIKVFGSYDSELKYATEIAHNKLMNNDFVVRPNECHNNAFESRFVCNFLVIAASATASIGASEVKLHLTGRKK